MARFALGLVAVAVLGACSIGQTQDISPSSLPPTLSFQQADGGRVAMQNGQPVPSFGEQPRPRLDLTQGWRFEPAALSEDLTFQPRQQSLSGLEREAGDVLKPDFDDSSWQPIAVPGSVNPPPRPTPTDGWYRLTFKPPAAWVDQAVMLKFGNASYLVDVWLNGKYIGYHEGGSTPFAFDPGKNLLPGESNVLVVRVYEPTRGSRLDVVPWGLVDAWDYAGLTGPVWLEASHPLHVVRADVVPHLDAADVSVVLQNSSELAQDGVSLRIEVLSGAVTDKNRLNPDPQSLVPPRSDPLATLTIDDLVFGAQSVLVRGVAFAFNTPDHWSVGRGALYVLHVKVSVKTVAVDNYYDTFGLRRIQVDPTAPRLLLNGTPVAFTGAAVHDELMLPSRPGNKPAGGIPGTLEDQLRIVRQAQAVNIDLLRTNHVAANPDLLMLTDRVGIGVWEEIPLIHYTPRTFNLVMQRGLPQQMLAEMALRDFNRPSVLFHGFTNESTGGAERTNAMQILHDLDRRIDGTRLTGQAMYGSDPTDPTSAPLDVAGYTFYYGIFYGGRHPEPGTSRALELAHRTYPHKPVMILEFGNWIDYKGNDRQQVNLFNGTYPAFAARFDTVENGYIGSAVWWSLNDYWTDVPGLTVEQFGMYRPDGAPRRVATLARDAFAKVALPAAPAPGIVTGGVGLPSVAPSPINLVLRLAYAFGITVGLVLVLIGALLWVRHRRTQRHWEEVAA
jgi:beta-galactosidase